jgi:hypothetical protein
VLNYKVEGHRNTGEPKVSWKDDSVEDGTGQRTVHMKKKKKKLTC